MIRFGKEKLGTLRIKQGLKSFNVEIRRGNCLAVFIQRWKDPEDNKRYVSLYNFYSDEQHIKNIIKNRGYLVDEDVVGIKLNMKYKESQTLLKYFVKEHKVECYYK